MFAAKTFRGIYHAARNNCGLPNGKEYKVGHSLTDAEVKLFKKRGRASTAATAHNAAAQEKARHHHRRGVPQEWLEADEDRLQAGRPVPESQAEVRADQRFREGEPPANPPPRHATSAMSN
jgi:hypothetical protein